MGMVAPLIDLTAMRRSSGLRLSDIIDQARRFDPDFPTTHAGYLGIEEHGTRDYWKIKALAAVFRVPIDDLAIALHPNNRRKNVA